MLRAILIAATFSTLQAERATADELDVITCTKIVERLGYSQVRTHHNEVAFVFEEDDCMGTLPDEHYIGTLQTLKVCGSYGGFEIQSAPPRLILTGIHQGCWGSSSTVKVTYLRFTEGHD